jgi:hypothetical protein
MHAIRLIGLLLALAWPGFAAESARAKIIKVLPQLLDRQGRHTLAPSLYERDAYQAHLRAHAQLRGGAQFAVLWKGRGASQFKLRIEMRGAREDLPTTAVIEANVIPRQFFRRWSTVALVGEDFRKLGNLLAWRATLWEQETLVAEERSFLW